MCTLMMLLRRGAAFTVSGRMVSVSWPLLGRMTTLRRPREALGGMPSGSLSLHSPSPYPSSSDMTMSGIGRTREGELFDSVKSNSDVHWCHLKEKRLLGFHQLNQEALLKRFDDLGPDAQSLLHQSVLGSDSELTSTGITASHAVIRGKSTKWCAPRMRATSTERSEISEEAKAQFPSLKKSVSARRPNSKRRIFMGENQFEKNPMLTTEPPENPLLLLATHRWQIAMRGELPLLQRPVRSFLWSVTRTTTLESQQPAFVNTGNTSDRRTASNPPPFVPPLSPGYAHTLTGVMIDSWGGQRVSPFGKFEKSRKFLLVEWLSIRRTVKHRSE